MGEEIKVGDRVECVDDTMEYTIEKYHAYEVTGVVGSHISIDGGERLYAKFRFRKLPPEKKEVRQAEGGVGVKMEYAVAQMLALYDSNPHLDYPESLVEITRILQEYRKSLLKSRDEELIEDIEYDIKQWKEGSSGEIGGKRIINLIRKREDGK